MLIKRLHLITDAYGFKYDNLLVMMLTTAMLRAMEMESGILVMNHFPMLRGPEVNL